MSLFRRERPLEIVSASGMVHVSINPRPAWLAMLAEAGGIVLFGAFAYRGWSSIPLFWRALLVWMMASAVIACFYQLSGMEIIEFDAQKLRLSRQVFGWNRTSEYPVSECHELEWRDTERAEKDHCGLQCKVGWRTIKFGRHISEGEAQEVLAAVQETLPDVARQMFATADSGKHFATLGLS